MVNKEIKVMSTASLQERGEVLRNALEQFKISCEVADIKTGPVVTRFELKLKAGTKSAAITNIARDIARCMSVNSIRVIDIIEGTDHVGVEVANATRSTVSYDSIINSEAYKNAKGIPLVMGVDIVGNPVVGDLTKMPHLLVAGTTGCGKSVLVNAMICGMLNRFTPEELKLVLIDPKQLEFASYSGLNHLARPVITDMDEAADALAHIVTMMEVRYTQMALAKVKNISDFNKQMARWKSEGTETAKQMPYVVVIIDEFADLITTNKEVEEYVMRLSQKSRAAGIHLIIATQRPSSDVITGVIKANIPSRIALTVASKMDSRIILDNTGTGAEALLGNGDMLVSVVGNNNQINRVHGCFVSDDQIEQIIRVNNAPECPVVIQPAITDEMVNESTSSVCEQEHPVVNKQSKPMNKGVVIGLVVLGLWLFRDWGVWLWQMI